MAKRLSLAEKYARSKQNDSESLRRSPIRSYNSILSPLGQNSRIRLSPSPKRGRLTSEIPELKPHSPAPKHGSDLDYKIGSRSSIRSVRKTHLESPNRIKLASQLYKTLPYNLSPNRNLDRSRISKDRSYLSGRQSSLDSRSRVGIFLRFKSFLNKFSLEEQERKNSQFEELRESARIPITEHDLNKEVDLDNLIGRKRKLSGDFDEVDSIVQKAKLRLEENHRNREKQELLHLLENEQLERKNLQEAYMRQINTMEQNHKAQIYELSNEIEDLTSKANFRLREFERQKLKEIENSVMKENESFLLQQRENEERLQSLKEQIQRKEEELEAREKRIEKRELEFSQKNSQEDTKKQNEFIFSEGAYDTSSPKIERKGTDNEENILKKEEETEKAADMYEFQVINFYDTMQRISERILNKQSGLTPEEQSLLQSLENIITSLDEHINARSKDLNGYEAKLDEYSQFFEEFNTVYAQSPTQARKKYSSSVLSAIKASFDRLKQSLNSRLTKKAQQLRDLESSYVRVRITEHHYSQYRIDRAVRILKGKADVILQQKRNIALLHDLGRLAKRISEIQEVVEPES